VSFCVLFVCKCVLFYCQRVSTQLQLINISYISNFNSYVQFARFEVLKWWWWLKTSVVLLHYTLLILYQNFHFAFSHVRCQNLLYHYFLSCLCLIPPASTLLFYPHLFTNSTIHAALRTATHLLITSVHLQPSPPDIQPVGLFGPADEGTRTPRNVRNYDTAKYPPTLKSQPLFIGYNSPLCVTCTGNYLSCTLNTSHCRADCNRYDDENCALLGYYAASSDNSLPTFRDILSDDA